MGNFVGVQFGTFKGNDDFYDEVKDRDISKLVLVEPNRDCNDYIKTCYKDIDNVHLENVAIHPDGNIKSVLLHKCHCLTSVNLQHILKHKGAYKSADDIKTFNASCLSPTKIFEKYKLDSIDLLYVDIEGMDEAVIYSIDFNRFDIKRIVYENLHINKKNLAAYLTAKGYTVTKPDQHTMKESYYNRIATKNA